ncbi:MAG: FAD-dependent oxidoreductase, partial [Clostridia bacterium]|nr:FAD-dependent oxidoreductase [Clostridia bacterium]
MKKFDIVVIGGSAAGITAAVTARRHYPGKSILLIRKEEKVSIPCGIPYVFGTVGDPLKNLIPVDNMLTGNKIEGIVDEAVDVERESNIITTLGGEKVAYERLVLATGSLPLIPSIPGAGLKNVFAVKKEVPYLQALKEKLHQSKNICIIGCGFIGVEIAEECRKACPDVNISIVEMQRNCLQLVFDEEFSLLVEKKLNEQNINLLLE